MMKVVQHTVQLSAVPRGIHLISSEVIRSIPELEHCSAGLLSVFICHTSASLSINENASPEVRTDLDYFLDRLVPDGFDGFKHTLEGSDDMPAHVKAALLGTNLTIPVSDGRLSLGTWQGIYLCEHRNSGGRRTLKLTLTGDFSRSI
ncbi:MAG: YjbQ family protein [Rhodothermales bacterium]|nr:YjbQ family protein [Rhodothermales bacterium]